MACSLTSCVCSARTTLTTRNNLANWLGEAGRVEEAVQQYELLLNDQLRALGPEHPHTLTTRNNLAN